SVLFSIITKRGYDSASINKKKLLRNDFLNSLATYVVGRPFLRNFDIFCNKRSKSLTNALFFQANCLPQIVINKKADRKHLEFHHASQQL
ncbi:hypothetical protein, partial [Geomicrobium sediminis]|uniref:hypothetical protein n=1 Tax=Geomicrobium sediminis TaxID=1347788 RepID=UPI00195BBCEF